MFDACRGDGRAGSRGCGGSSRLRSGTTGGAFIASLLALVDFLLLLVDAHGDELDHHVGDAHAALHFVHQIGRARKNEQHVTAFVEFRNAIGQLADAPVVNFVDRTLAGGDHLLDLVDIRLDLFLRRVRFKDKQLFVDSHSSSSFKPWARRLNTVMDFSTPSAIMDSTAAQPCATASSTSCCCDRLKGRNTNSSPLTS